MSAIGASSFLAPPPPPGDELPSTPELAAEAIADLKRNPEFTRRLLAGDSDAKKKWSDLHEISARPTRTVTGDLPSHSERAIDAIAEYADISPEVQTQLRSGQAVSPAEFKAAVQRRAQLMADKEWGARYRAGDQRARRELTLVNVILSSKLQGS